MYNLSEYMVECLMYIDKNTLYIDMKLQYNV